MNKYVIVAFLGDIPPGTSFADSKWPLHVTLIRPFVSVVTEEELVTTLTKALENTKSFSLAGVSEELFGPDLNIPVVEMEKTEEVAALNILLKKTFVNLADSSQPDKFTEYRPHVTCQSEGRISVGDNVAVNSVSLVRYEPGMRFVVATAELK